MGNVCKSIGKLGYIELELELCWGSTETDLLLIFEFPSSLFFFPSSAWSMIISGTSTSRLP